MVRMYWFAFNHYRFMSDSNTKTAIITAILTGVFTVIAGLATYWVTNKEPALTYSVVGGPSLPGVSGEKRIFVVEIRNSGKKEVPNAFLRIALNVGSLSEVASEASAGVRIREERGEQKIDIVADLLNPKDIVTISFLAESTSRLTEPQVFLRAPGVTAVSESVEKNKSGLFGSKNSGILTLIVAAIAAVSSSLFLMLSKSKVAQKLGMSGAISGSIVQAEIGSFICGTCYLYSEAEQLRFGGSDISYRGIADYLQHRAALADESKIQLYDVALRALLLCENMAENSAQAIAAAIRSIGSAKFNEQDFRNLRLQAIKEGADPVAWRKKIEEFVHSQIGSDHGF